MQTFHSEAYLFQVVTEDQAQTDRYWEAILGNGGSESPCGRCKDKWGVFWQISPREQLDALQDPELAAAKRSFEAMMARRKIDSGAIERARRG